MKRLLLGAVGVMSVCGGVAHAGIVTFETANGRFEIDQETLALSGAPSGGSVVALSKPAFEPGAAQLEAGATTRRWSLSNAETRYRVSVEAKHGALEIAIAADTPGAKLHWPISASIDQIEAYALPIYGEGKYIPADDPGFLKFLSGPGDHHDAEGLSVPLWTEMRGRASLTWIIDPPYDTVLKLRDENGRLGAGLVHHFTPLAPGANYRISVRFGAPNPVAGAKGYRNELVSGHRFTDLREKTARNGDVARLGGAPHIYLHSTGVLKTDDVTAWRRFIRRFDARRSDPETLSFRIWKAFDAEAQKGIEAAFGKAKGPDGFVSHYNRTLFMRALSNALQTAVPLKTVDPIPGGHDPAAQKAWIYELRAALVAEYPGCFAPPESWGGGLSLGIIGALQKAGIERAWLGTGDWLDVLWHPEAAAAAKDAGYLLGAYDSYGSAHPTTLKATWKTAQMGDEIFQSAAYRKADGTRVTGFADRGVYVNPAADEVESYARRRINAIAKATSPNSYFLDVDATGYGFSDYTKGRETPRRAVEDAQRRRLGIPYKQLNLVTGSEGGVSQFAEFIHFAHGMTTVPFKWLNQAMKTKGSPYNVGGYWPPESPDIFFKQVPLPPDMQRLLFDPAYRLPLYEMVLHDGVISTHHWEYSSLKFSNEVARTELLQILYMVPPLYHLNAETLKRDLPIIADYTRRFAPLHAALFDKPMTDFAFLSADRLLQRTAFEGGVTITANFSGKSQAAPEGHEVPPMAALVLGLGAPQIIASSGIGD